MEDVEAELGDLALIVGSRSRGSGVACISYLVLILKISRSEFECLQLKEDSFLL